MYKYSILILKVGLLFFLGGIYKPVNGQQIINVTNAGISPSLQKDQSERINYIIRKYPKSKLIFPSGTYYINSLKIRNTDISIQGQGKVIFYGVGSKIQAMIHVVNAAFNIQGVILDGQGVKSEGITIYNYRDSAVIRNCTLRDYYGTNNAGAVAVRIRRSEGYVGIFNTNIQDIDGPGNGKVGDRGGANRGIVINDVDSVVVEGCHFSNVKGFEDGDCIHYIRWDHGKAKKVIIKDNVFTDIYKRAIKIHGNNTIVTGNKIYSFKKDPSYAGISIYGDDNLISNNYIDLNSTSYGIEISNNQNNVVEDNTIKINKFKWPNVNGAIFIINAKNVHLKKNSIQSPKGDFILMRGTDRGVYRNKTRIK